VEAITKKNLQNTVAMWGGANTLLYNGPKVTREITAELEFEDKNKETLKYHLRLGFGFQSRLVIADEFADKIEGDILTSFRITGGGTESSYDIPPPGAVGLNHEIYHLLKSIRVYHFHDTSFEARIMSMGNIVDFKTLHGDFGNLAAFLYMMWLNDKSGSYYKRLIETIRLFAPFFDDFALDPLPANNQQIVLAWKQFGSDLTFGAQHFSDGTLRMIALCALLLQPEEDLPSVIFLDEPELGLHPAAVELLAGLVRKASHFSQIVIATQSPELLSLFEAEDVVVVERDVKDSGASVFKRLDTQALDSWLKDYSLGELWEKNVLGGKPK
jgi:predicted ATPase